MVTGGSFEANIISYNGHEWNMMKIDSVDSKYDLGRISGSAAFHIFAAGSNGSVMHYNGKEWREVGDTKANFNDSYTAVWTYSLYDTFVVGMDGVVLHYSYNP
jgi:photosystem II stability/assembly factor-like uncharacterized protein